MACSGIIRSTGQVDIIDLKGRVTLGDGSGVIRETVKGLVEKGSRSILLNLAEVTYIDSAGLGDLVGSYATVTSVGGHMKLLHAQKRVHDVLQITKLYTVFEAFTDEAAAVASFQTPAARAAAEG
ncbi:MAG: STAS domain-containing protein [Acidobacteria bacterium]|nr:STAS domain-containing protein [Acidobacteriota bacterium]